MTTQRKCEDFELLLIDREDAPLSDGDARALQAHLDVCAACQGFAAELRPLVAKAREELAPADPGEAFFVRTRNEVWSVWRANVQPAQALAPASPSVWARVMGWLFGGKRGFASAAVGFATAALVGVLLWPRPAKPPVEHPTLPTVKTAPIPVVQPDADAPSANGEGDVLPEISTLSSEELHTLSHKLVIETNGEAELEEDPEGLEGQLEGMSGDELRALDNQITLATKEPKGA